jgi:ABC-type lipoprotein release transport system permease subunit
MRDMRLALRLTWRKLVINRRRNLTIICFFAALASIVMTITCFMAGSDAQMKRSLRQVMGDASLSARSDEDELSDLQLEAKDVFSEGDSVLGFYRAGVQLTSASMIADSVCLGAEAAFFPHFGQSVAWQEISPPASESGPRASQGLSIALDPGSVFLEASLAAALGTRTGERVSVRYRRESGRVNSAEFAVAGVFIGSSLLFKGYCLMSLEDMDGLILEPGSVNEIRVYRAGTDAAELKAKLRQLNETWYDRVLIQSATLDPEGSVFGIYKYYNLVIGLVLWMLVLIFLVVLHFSNKNVFHMEYRRRRIEISTFLAYGMTRGRVRILVLTEAFFLGLGSLVLAGLFSLATCLAASRFAVTSLSQADLITAMGGPRLTFAVPPGLLVVLSLVMFSIMIASALSGANRYLGLEVREIYSGRE